MNGEVSRVFKEVRGIPATLSYATRKTRSGRVDGPEFRIDLYENIFSRYLYTFLKFLALEGLRIVMKARPATISSIIRSQYGDLLIKEGLLELGISDGRGWDLGDKRGAKRLQAIDFLKPKNPKTVYDVPMAQHPVMYHSGHWNCEESTQLLVRSSVLFLGNPDPDVYGRIGRDGNFRVADRVFLWRELATRKEAVVIDDLDSLEKIGSGRVVLVDSRSVKIGFDSFRRVIAGYHFFLCAPGVFMPLCHNLIESLSVGGIPVIQKSYSDLLSPPLEDGVNAVIFDREGELNSTIDRCLSMSDVLIAKLAKNARLYYDEYLTPAAVTKSVLSPEVETVRLLAGERSVKLLSRRSLLM